MTRPVDLIVIGGSAGAIEVLRQVLTRLTTKFSPSVAIVIHLPAEGPNVLHEILAGAGTPPMKVAEDKEPIAPGTIYFAPTDYHLLVESGRTFALSIDPRVHFARPSIDVLFESAAQVYAERLVGVLLSGASSDGAAGLAAIQARGGAVYCQDPRTALERTMPDAGCSAARAARVASPEAIGRELSELLAWQPSPRQPWP